MKTTFKYILVSMLVLSLSSCDAIIFVIYRVKNTTQEKIKLNIKSYPRTLGGAWGETVDTIIELDPKESVYVGSRRGIGFPWGSKTLFYEQRGWQNFNLMEGDSIIKIDADDKYWTYYSQVSTFRIKEKHLSKNY